MSQAPACGRLPVGTSGVDRSQAASHFWGERPRKGDWSGLWLDVIMRCLATSDKAASPWWLRPGDLCWSRKPVLARHAYPL
jgi:hypothetical protein